MTHTLALNPSALLHADAHWPSRALAVPIQCKIVEVSVRARHGVQVVVDVVPVAQGVPPPPQREVRVLQEQRAIQHTLLVDLQAQADHRLISFGILLTMSRY